MASLVSDDYGVYQSWTGLRQTCSGPSDPHRQGISGAFGVRASRPLAGRWAMSSTALSHAGGTPHSGAVARVGCAVSPLDFEHDGPDRQGRDICSSVRSGTRGAVAVLGPPGHRRHEQRGRAGTPFRGDVAQADPRDLQRKGQSLGGTGVVVSPDLSHPGSPNVSPAGGSGAMPVQRDNS